MGIASLLLVLGVGAGVALMLPAAPTLQEARLAMEVGRDALLNGDAARAGRAFRRAESAFDQADAQLANPLTRLASLVPLLGRTPDAVAAGVEGGTLTARAGIVLSDAAEGLPGGVAALAPRNGVIPLEPLIAVAPPLREARGLVVRADQILRAAPRSLVPGVVAEPLESFAAEVAEARGAVATAEAVSRVVPRFLGGEGVRRYFFGAQNPAELRGTGGLIGAYAILTAEEGRIDLGTFRDIGRLGSADPSAIDPPNPDYASLYPGEHADFSNINMTPDFPAAATAIERLYEHQTGERLDGAIVADPHALALLIEVVGPTTVPATGTTISEKNVVPYVTNEAYALLPNDAARKRILGQVADEVLTRFLDYGAADDPVKAGELLVRATGDGHLLFHSVEPEVQAAFGTAGVTGRLLEPEGDYLAVVVNNAGGNKIDFYAERSVRYEVQLLEDGWARGRTRLTFLNNAPSRGQPTYVIGPHPFTDARAGDNTMIVGVYCANGCSFRSFRRDGMREGLAVGEELGHPEAMTGYRIPSGSSGTLEYEWVVPGAWSERRGQVVYRLTIQDQPTIRPTSREIVVRIPEGAQVSRTTPGMRVVGDRVIWSGEAGDVVRLEVSFAPPFGGTLFGRAGLG